MRNWFDMPVEPWTVRGLPCDMAFYLYMLRCADGSYYTGHSDDPDRRVHEHHEGLIPGCYTHDRRPLLLVHVQEFGSREDALAAEVQVKRWSRAKKEALIAQDWDALRLLARAKGAGESVHGSTGSPRTELLGSSPQTGGSTGSRRTELAGGSTGSPRTELAGGSTGSPRTGRSKGSPRTCGSTGSPRTELGGGSVGSPQTGGSTSSPRMGGSTGSPRTELFGGSVGSPQTGGSTGSPRTGRLKGSPRTELLGSSP